MSHRSARLVVLVTLACLALLPTASTASADECRTITIIHPYGAGSASAGVMRLLAEELRARLGTPTVVDYRPGALGVPSAHALMSARPDGCTIGVLAGIHSSSPWFMDKPSYDPTSGFVPITQVAEFPNVLVTADPRMRTFGDFLARAKAEPGKLNVGTMSPGSPDFLTGLFLKDAGVPINVVPYTKEAIQMPVDVQNGSLHVGIQNFFVFLGSLQQGSIWPLAVTTKARLGKFPDVPTIFESGLPNFVETKSWFGIFGPPGLLSNVTRVYNREVTAILREESFAKKLADLGIQAKPSTPEELARTMADDHRLQGDAIRRFRSQSN